MSLVSFLIPLCLKPHCDSLSCELSNLILGLLMLKYIIISDVSEDFTVLIMALNQIGDPLSITQAVPVRGSSGLAELGFRAAQHKARQREVRAPRGPGPGSCSVSAFVPPWLLVQPRGQRRTIAPAGSAAGQERLGQARRSWHLLLVRAGRARGQRAACSKLTDGLERLVD